MSRPRKGKARLRYGKWWWRVTLRDQRQVVREVPPRADGRPITETYARAFAETLQHAYDQGETSEAELRGKTPAKVEPRPGLAPVGGAAPADAPAVVATTSELPTLLAYVRAWLATQDYTTVADDRRRVERYLRPTTLAVKPLDAITAMDILLWLKWLASQPSRRGGTLAPRSIINAYDVVRRALAFATFEHAARMPVNPCDRLPAGSVPAARDKHPEKRARWIFTRDEVARLCTSPLLPEYRRVEHAILFFAGPRIGECAAFRWRDYDDALKPLGCWTLARSIERKTRVEKSTKTGAVRFVPIHPALAEILAAWRAEGWARHMGRTPTESDLVVPTTKGTPLDASNALRRFYEDLALLGMRRRHVHCTRRTFISLCRDDGGRGEILRWITHGPTRKEQTDIYSSLAWATFCQEVQRLTIDLTPRGQLLQMPLASGDEHRRIGTTPGTTSDRPSENPSTPEDGQYQGRDLNPSRPSRFVAIRQDRRGDTTQNPTEAHGLGTGSGTVIPLRSYYRCEGELWAWADRVAAKLAEERAGEGCDGG